MPEVLTPSTLLTQRSQSLKAASGNFSQVNLYSRQRRKFQYLANVSWARWRKSIYQCFNPGGSGNKKLEIWRKETLLLLCSKELPRNSWPLAHITKAYISESGKLCKEDLMTSKDSMTKTYTRPVTEVILLRSEADIDKMKKTICRMNCLNLVLEIKD